MSAYREEQGYALLAAVFIMALAAIFAAACVTAVGARLEVARSDGSAAAASTAAREVLDRACLGLQRRPGRLDWSASGSWPAAGGAWSLRCSPLPQVEATAALQIDVTAVAARTGARRVLHAFVALRPAPGAQGLQVAHDVRLAAPLTVGGGGLYSGGSVSGREWVTFVGANATGGSSPDLVHGDRWPVAAVHALGGIFAGGEEVHSVTPPDSAFAADTDLHTGAGDIQAVVDLPDAEHMALLYETADVVVSPDQTGVVDLATLPPSQADVVVIVDDTFAGPVVVCGERPAGASRLVVVVDGDARLGSDGGLTALEGALVCSGDVTVCGPTRVVGHVAASRLEIEAPLDVVTPADWAAQPLPGLVDAALLAVGR